ncbi:cytosolic Fe-S cluster assembly factor narfl [Salix suchowensis]|nr:cytosolic Fe-S cluster assembly factor narfl [Salix suchowensis]
MGLRPDEVYHVTVMPCYDKKLEAVRDDFVFEVEQEDANKSGLRITEVDSVLTTGEVLDLIKLKAVDFETLDDYPLDKMLTNVNEEGYLYGVPGSSGGYAETVFGMLLECYLEEKSKALWPSKVFETWISVKWLWKVPEWRWSNQAKATTISKRAASVIRTIYMENVLIKDPFENLLVKSLYDEWLEQPGSEKAKRHMHTAYHPMVKSVTAQLHNW